MKNRAKAPDYYIHCFRGSLKANIAFRLIFGVFNHFGLFCFGLFAHFGLMRKRYGVWIFGTWITTKVIKTVVIKVVKLAVSPFMKKEALSGQISGCFWEIPRKIPRKIPKKSPKNLQRIIIQYINDLVATFSIRHLFSALASTSIVWSAGFFYYFERVSTYYIYIISESLRVTSKIVAPRLFFRCIQPFWLSVSVYSTTLYSSFRRVSPVRFIARYGSMYES